MSTDPDRVKSTFLEASELADPAARAAYLGHACGGDAGLRGRVEALLRSHDAAGSFLGTPAAGVPDPAPPAPDGESEALRFLTPPARPDSLGRLGHYEVLEVLGRGGFGTVVRAFDETLQRVVAIKLMAPELAATSAARKRFLREARSSAQVRHENVVRVYAVEEQPLPYLVMEFIPGETLQQRLDRAGPLAVEEAVRIGQQVAEGLAAAHATGLIHRDIKPANILIEAGPNLHVKITDFGLARAADDASLTQSGVIAGTPLFMAPEQAQGDALDHRADLFSLGSVLYTMCSGRAPFRANGTLAVLKRVAEDTPRPIREIIPEVPPWLCDLIGRLHAKDPDDRVATAREVAELLARGPAETPPPATLRLGGAAPDAAPATWGPRSRPRHWAVAAALLLAAGGLSSAEASGVTNVRGTVTRLFSAEGTLVVEVDDPGVSIQIDGADLVITGAGAKEIRLKPGSYTVEARKGGQVVSRELVAVTRDGRQVVRVSQEASPADPKPPQAADAAAWGRAVAALPAALQAAAVAARLKDLNPGFDGKVTPTIEGGVVTGLRVRSDAIVDITPVRALTGLTALDCSGTWPSAGVLADLSPLRGLRLTSLKAGGTRVHDLEPLRGMPLASVNLYVCRHVSDLTPLRGLPLTSLNLGSTGAKDLAPLKGMALTYLNLYDCPIPDLEPLRGLPLATVVLGRTQVRDLTPLKGLPLTSLNLWGCAQVRDLTPLRGLPLRYLHVGNSGVADLTPLGGMPLEEFFLSPKSVGRGLGVVRDLKGLKAIGVDGGESRPAAEFWTRYDAGEFE